MIFRSIRLGSLFIFAFSAHNALAQSQPADSRSDTKSWNEVQFTVPFSEQVEMTLSGEFRFGRNLSNFVDERVGASLRFKLGKYFDLSPGYEYIVKQTDRTRSIYENRSRLPELSRYRPAALPSKTVISSSAAFDIHNPTQRGIGTAC